MLERIIKAQKSMEESCKRLGREVRIMEVCGTHTVSIFRNGIREMLPENLKMLSGPGCPVCVTHAGYIDAVLELTERNGCIIATYGDMMRVPGQGGSLETKATKRDVKVVLSSDDALELARQNPSKVVVFIAVGFETTTPASAVVVKEAAEQGIDNFCILSNHKLVVPAMRALLSDKKNSIDAFLCPGHVSVIIGSRAYSGIVEEFSRPCVVAGFEPVQIMEGLAVICKQLVEGKAEVDNVYGAVVKSEGNTKALEIIEECFDEMDGYWRGLGKIGKSTLQLKEEFSEYDAYKCFGISDESGEDKSSCQCGEVLCGLIDPPECKLFGNTCSPDNPVGPCMVSSEGACSAWYKYHRKEPNG
ncbi:MAG: hydrogenase formation protein HypD [Planctomycetota bacterium]|jgi:hydrogenase expression/formation protein HypD